MSAPAALGLRWTVLRRRYLSPLEVALVAGLSLVSYYAGQELGEAVPLERLASFGWGAWLALALALGALAHQQLYRAPELGLLLAHGVSARVLGGLRLVELALVGLALVAPLASLAAGAARGAGVGPEGLPWSLLAGAGVLNAVALAGAALVLGWLRGRSWGGPVYAGLGLICGGLLVLAGVGVSAAGASRLGPLWLRAGAASPWGGLLSAAAGQWQGLLPAAALALALPGLGLALVPLGQGEAMDRAGRRPSGRTSRLGALVEALWRPVLGRPAAALAARDAVILVRGGFPRGLFVLAAGPLLVGLLYAVGGERSLMSWQLGMAVYLVAGVSGSAAGYLFGVDFPQARARQRVLERSLPLRGRDVLRSRWGPAAAYAGVIGLGGALAVGLRAPESPPLWLLALGVVLLVVAISHDAAAFGLGSEAGRGDADAAGYPFRAGVLVVVLAGAVTIHPLGVLLYPLLGYLQAAAVQIRAWEQAEVASESQASA